MEKNLEFSYITIYDDRSIGLPVHLLCDSASGQTVQSKGQIVTQEITSHYHSSEY